MFIVPALAVPRRTQISSQRPRNSCVQRAGNRLRTVNERAASNVAFLTASSPKRFAHCESSTPTAGPARVATVHRSTGETTVKVTVNIDGSGICRSETGIPFLDHMLHQISSHGLVDLDVWAEGDLHIDDHHTNEDVGITLGLAIAKALGDKAGVNRFGHFVAPLDEALVQVALDFSGRPHLEYGLQIPTERIGSYDTQLIREFFVALVANTQMTLHIRQLAGINSHHIVEACFKAFARAMRQAAEYDPRRIGKIPSSKGVLGDFAVTE